jgi:RimJ/RimL family protein N-acetyltransferase
MVGGQTEIAISVAPGYRERGYGRAILAEVTRRFAEEIMPEGQLRARVLAHNIASLKLFKSCGFHEVGVEQHGDEQALVFEFMGPSVHGAQYLR